MATPSIIGWDFSKLPDNEYGNIRNLLKNYQIKDLAKIHDKYDLSSNNYCCNELLRREAMLNWFSHGLKEYERRNQKK